MRFPIQIPLRPHAPVRCTLCIVAAAGIAFLAIAGRAQASPDTWPGIEMPPQSRPIDLGRQLEVNGVPTRMQGFVSKASPDNVVDWFRHHFGEKFVEDRYNGAQILGRQDGEYYLTVFVEPAGTGARGVASVAHLKAGYESLDQNKANASRILNRMPAGSRVINQTVSTEASRSSIQMVLVNGFDPDLNRDRVIQFMADDGLQVEQEGASALAPPSRRNPISSDGLVLFFRGRNKEAMATIHRDASRQTTLVLNIITSLERAP